MGVARRKDPNATDGLPLNDQQRFFCREYIIDFNGQRAAIAAGYSPKTAKSQASDLLTRPNLQAFLQTLINKRAAAVQVTAEDVLRDLLKVKDRCLQAEPVLDKTGAETGEYRFDSSGANKSLELVGKHLRMFVDRHEVVDVQSAKQFASDVLGIVIRRVPDPKVREAIVADIEALCRA